MERVGIRELRNDVAAVVRRAGGGERLVVSVDGRPVAQLGPLDPAGPPTIDDLAALGLVRLPGRREQPPVPHPTEIPVDARLDTALEELRGHGDRR